MLPSQHTVQQPQAHSFSRSFMTIATTCRCLAGVPAAETSASSVRLSLAPCSASHKLARSVGASCVYGIADAQANTC